MWTYIIVRQGVFVTDDGAYCNCILNVVVECISSRCLCLLMLCVVVQQILSTFFMSLLLISAPRLGVYYFLSFLAVISPCGTLQNIVL